MRPFITLFFIIIFASSEMGMNPTIQAEEKVETIRLHCRNALSDSDIAQVKESKGLIQDVDAKSLQRTLLEMEETECPTIHVFIIEAMARTYDDIVREQNVQEQKKKNWLYSKIQLNMAFLQLTGGTQKGDADPLNRLIRLKLKEYLPSGMLTHPAFFQKVEELLE